MKFFLSLLGVATFCVALSQAIDTDRLNSVSYFNGIEEVYRRVRNKKPHLHAEPTTDLDTKNRICNSITHSQFFTIWGENPVDIEEMHEKLKFEYPNIFEALYKKCENTTSVHMVYANPTKLINVCLTHCEETVSEYVFVCLTQRDWPTPKIVKYYVSQEYNVSNPSYAVENYAAGRFVFAARDEGDDSQLELYALAEEPARALLAPEYDVEKLYLEIRKEYMPIQESIALDPVCNLTWDENVRVCAIIMNSNFFEGKLEFKPSIQHVSKLFEKRNIGFREDHIKNQIAGRNYEERVISCSVRRVSDGTELKYFFSQADKSNKLFVYTEHDGNGQIFLENLSINVRF